VFGQGQHFDADHLHLSLKQKGKAIVDGGVVAEAEFMAMMIDRQKEG